MTHATVVVVDLRIDPASLPACEAVLDGEERQRAGRFLREADRWRFIASHAAMRMILGQALAASPSILAFAREEGGRPFLVGPGEGLLDFSLSHSGDHAVIGFVRGTRIGVDIEARRPLADALRIAGSHFAADETAALAALPPPAVEASFFGLWTRKEAVVKALGTGLSLPLSRFSVSVPPKPPLMLRQVGIGTGWTLAEISAPPGTEATVAVTTEAARITVEHLAPGWADTIAEK
ncbi:4'-phosphopantetheinyl transferase family protein [Methylobacterium aerolatum]|uniref:4'-phosphopantetheinyl transferase n=1 Tax=Methylobacterium aerolatum TaxID=418708 RepID=A0ABU0HZJ8_9HYPH|nr:4'-phosphopantetheinyl transferase superfamily protein [Methylobacterium aerolatum]MDQ0447765.1 4'-phosphopantetheinyl transferase [Methylobacterium aerolatum]GJD34863.1 4'-phosphopantetheinyl transferase Sfp [Methylobacterium aerolatum]